MDIPPEDLQSIATILATGYLRHRAKACRENLVDKLAEPSLHGHEVNASENGGRNGSSAAD